MHTSDTLLYDAFDLLEHVGILFINPVSQVSAVIQDLIGDTEKQMEEEEKDNLSPKNADAVKTLIEKVSALCKTQIKIECNDLQSS